VQGRVKKLCLLLLTVISAAAQSVDLSGPWKLSMDDDLRLAQAGVDDSNWPIVNLPQREPRDQRVYWLRRTIHAPAISGPMRITIGLVAESYELYVNGSRIGDTGDFGQREVGFFRPRSFAIPAGLIRAESPVVICLRIWNIGASWGSLTAGLRDHGPYWITTPEHAAAEIDSATKELRLDLTPAWLVSAGECSIAVCLLLLWVAERERRELLYFAIYLFGTGLGSLVGIWVVFTGSSSFWYLVGFRPAYDVAFLFLCLAAGILLRLPLTWLVLGCAAAASAALTFRTVYYLYPWLILLTWQCVRALRKALRPNLPLTLPLLAYVLGIFNNTLPPGGRLFPAAIGLEGMTVSVTNLIQLLFAGAMLIVLLQRLASDRREKQRLAAELDAAREIQRSLLPQDAPKIDGYSIAFRSSTCYEVGGDYLDTFTLPAGEQVMIVADVAGKGLPAALVSTSFRSAFRAAAGLGGVGLHDIAAQIGQLHWNEGPEARRRYVTAIFLKLDPGRHCIEVVNAGHNTGFLVQSGGTVHSIEASGPPLGILPGIRYTAETLSFPEGTRLLLYTDGMTEVFREGDEEFGPERLLEHFRNCSERDSQGMLDSIWRALKDFGGEIRQQDDMTALVVLRTHS
jgi:serine phosphatase RsbU (regulator of sigma subunit)